LPGKCCRLPQRPSRRPMVLVEITPL